MQAKHSMVLNTLQRVQRFMDANANALGTLNSSKYRKILDDAAASLSEHAVNQSASKRLGSGETAKQRVLQSALKVNHLRPIAAVAAAELKQIPEFLAFTMPPANGSSQQLIASAGGMAKAAALYVTTFTGSGLDPDFLVQLHAAADELNTSVANRGATKTIQNGATAGLDAEEAKGRKAVKVLNTLIEPKLAGDAVRLVQWQTAKRFAGKSTVVTGTSVDAAAKGISTDTPPAPTTGPTPTVAPTDPAPGQA